MAMNIVYGFWEGDPAILAKYPDGRIYGFAHLKGEWKDMNAADVATKMRVTPEAQFNEMAGKIGLPVFPK